jgi:hypothetical protein
LFVGVTLSVFAVLLGVFPYTTVLRYMDATVNQQVASLTEWTRTVKDAQLRQPPPVESVAAAVEPAQVAGSPQ